MIFSKDSALSLILPTAPTPRELFAAEELTKYLKRIFGLRVIKNEKADKNTLRVLLGAPHRNPAARQIISCAEFEALLTGEEGIFIECKENTLLIAGSEGFDDMERGTVYAVYECLERFFGCTLAAYTAPNVTGGEIVPSLDQLEINDTRYVKSSADLPYRTAIVQYGDSAGNPQHMLNVTFFDWLVKNRYNRILLWTALYEEYKELGLIEELEKRGIRLSVGHHDAQELWLPFYGNKYFPEQYLITHPEYFRLCGDGKRFAPSRPNDPRGQWLYCSRNEECIEQVANNILAWSKQNPLVDVIAFWPKDGVYEQCSCEKCAKYTKVENYTYFQNEVARRLYRVNPKLMMDICVYVDLWKCPAETLSPNLLIEESTWGQELRRCGKPDGSGIIGTEYETNAAEWKNTGAQVVYYDYYMGVYGNRQRVIPMADEIQALQKYYQRAGLLGSGTQAECFHIWNHLVNLYTFGRTSYNTDLTLEDNLQRLAPLFGEGADEILQAVRIMEETLDGQEQIIYAGEYMITHVDKARVYELFEIALRKTTSPICRNNIRLMRMAFRYSELETQDSTNVKDREYEKFQTYEDPTGELAYMATHFDSFHHNNPGYGIAFPITNIDTKSFIPDEWYNFD